MKRIYTRSGDKGMTGIHGGAKVPKTDIRIEANGTVDELNVAIGSVRTLIASEHIWQPFLKYIQETLMAMMSLIATPDSEREKNPNHIPEDIIEQIEATIDALIQEDGEAESFLLPGGSPLAASLHQARVITRRAERRLWSLNEIDPVPTLILKYFNRLSDLFFIMARHDVLKSDNSQEIWKEFSYKRR